jgi:hypothetical protein
MRLRSSILSSCFLLSAISCLGASLTGKITQKNAPVNAAAVTLYTIDPARGTRGRTYATRSTPQGIYSFPSIPGGDYILIVEKDQQRVFQGQLSIQQNANLRKDVAVGRR